MGKMETDFFEETQKHLNHMTNIKKFHYSQAREIIMMNYL